MNDDDDLKPYDLSAWGAPPPPEGLADRVVARMTAADDAIAVALEHQRPRRRLWIAGGIAAVAAVSLGVWIGVRASGGSHDAAPTSGVAVADKPRRLELGASTASLDAGAEVRWRREGDALTVEQRAGAATWNIAGSDRLVIDAGAGVASVEARNANVRVEVQMNSSDLRVVAGSAATAATVALVTAVVYEGYVRVGGAHQTVVVQPGASVEVKPGQPPHDVPVVGATRPQPLPPVPSGKAELVIPGGESATIHVPGPDPLATKVVVQIKSPCKTATDLRIDAPNDMNEDIATLGPGSHHYEIRCDGATTPTHSGAIEVVSDDANRPLPPPPARTTIEADGRRYTVTAASTIPELVIHVPTTAAHYHFDLDHDGAPFSSVDSELPTMSMAPPFGTYTIRVKLDGKLASTTTLVVALDQHAPVAMLAEPVDQQPWSSPVRVAGEAIAGADVSVSGVGVVVGDQRRFAANLELGDATSLAVRVQHPQHGIHYYVRHAPARVATAPSLAKPRLAVLGLEPTAPDKTTVAIAGELTQDLRARAKAGTGPYLLGPGTDKELVDEKLLNNCTTEAPACMAQIGAELGVDVMMVGKLAPKGADYEVTVKLLDVQRKAFVKAATFPLASSDASGAALAGFAKTVYAKLAGDDKVAFDFSGCDAEALVAEGTKLLGSHDDKAALAKIEEAVACEDDPHTRELAFMAACNVEDTAKAHAHWDKLPRASRTKLVQLCIRHGITEAQLDARPEPAVPSCNAQALVDKGTQASMLGQHAAALSSFEKALACKVDPHTIDLAFMAACNAKNVTKARQHWRQIAFARRPQVLQMCARAGITEADLDRGTDQLGTLVLQSNPPARLFLDGKDTGLTTPITGLAVAPGKHKVNLRTDEDHLFAITVEAGNTLKVVKDFSVPASPTCDAGALRDQGTQAEGLGQHAQAVKAFEQALACRFDAQTNQLAFMAACNATNVSKAKTFWKRMSPEAKNRNYQICARFHILREQLDGP